MNLKVFETLNVFHKLPPNHFKFEAYNIQILQYLSTMIQLRSAFTPLPCPTHQPDRQHLIHICLLPCCRSQPLACKKCLQQSHSTHPSVSTGKFSEMVQNLIYDRTLPDDIERFRRTVKDEEAACLGIVVEMRREVERKIAEVQEKVRGYFGEKKQQLEGLTGREGMVRFREFGVVDGRRVPEVIREVAQFRAEFFQTKRKKEEIILELEDLKVEVTEQTINIKQLLSQQLCQILTSLSQLQTLSFSRLPQPKTPIFGWSPTQKHPDLQISSTFTVTRSMSTPTPQGRKSICCLSQSPLPCSWSLHIKQLRKALVVGLCQPEYINSYERWNWKDTGHGHYCVNSRCGVFSHTDPNVNCTVGAMGFEEGDRLQFGFDGEVFRVQNKGKCQEMTVQVGRQYVFCVYLLSVGDSVELIPPP